MKIKADLDPKGMTVSFELCETGNLNIPVNNAFVLTSGISLRSQTVASRASPGI